MAVFDIHIKRFLSPDQDTINRIIRRPAIKRDHLEDIIDQVYTEVKADGDAAILKLTEQFDNVRLTNLNVSKTEIEEGIAAVSPELKKAIDTAGRNIQLFHESQKLTLRKIETTPGVQCWQEARPIQKVGLYIPGGSAPLFSTVLMLGIPAMVAGCRDVVLCTPPGKLGKIHPAILYAANKCGITKIIKAGGAQAIAGMVCGTESIPGVYKIFGPGNQFVTAAKMKGMTLGVAIDLPAGPSEVLVYADETANPVYVAADLLSQAEHGIDSQVVLVTTSEELVEKVVSEINSQLIHLSRADTAVLSLAHAYACVFEGTRKVFDFINQYAPEHLIIASNDAEDHIDKVINAGSVFVGHLTPESAGDYASGTNHTLPTAAFARSYSGVSLDSFIKKISFQKINEEGLRNLGQTIITMANNEELTAHANAVKLRLQDL